LETGSLAELVSAFGALAALFAAGIAAKAAVNTNRQQTRQLAHLEESERRRRTDADQKDATKIATWTGLDDGRPVIRLINQSGLPVYELTVWVKLGGSLLKVPYVAHGPAETRVLRRATAAILAWAESQEEATDWGQIFSNRGFLCATTFRDTSNRWWLRDFEGVLSSQVGQESAILSLQDSYRNVAQQSLLD
jgi:hypothetical protein